MNQLQQLWNDFITWLLNIWNTHLSLYWYWYIIAILVVVIVIIIFVASYYQQFPEEAYLRRLKKAARKERKRSKK